MKIKNIHCYILRRNINDLIQLNYIYLYCFIFIEPRVSSMDNRKGEKRYTELALSNMFRGFATPVGSYTLQSIVSAIHSYLTPVSWWRNNTPAAASPAYLRRVTIMKCNLNGKHPPPSHLFGASHNGEELLQVACSMLGLP